MMMKAVILFCAALATVASAQEAAEESAAPEPYAYAYQTDSHQASEQRSPDGRVTGFYTIVDQTDGRERRVEYMADSSGFHAKVATNELGTKSENSADVEVQASPPTEAQLAYQAQSQQLYQQQQYVKQSPPVFSVQQPQQLSVSQSPALTTSTVQQTSTSAAPALSLVQQPGYNVAYGYYPGYGYGYQGYQGGATYGVNTGAAYGMYGNSGTYNYHLPAQYYSRYQNSRVVQQSGQPQVSTYTVDGAVQPGVSGYTVGSTGGQNVVTGSRYVSSARTVPGPTTYTYSSGPIRSSTTRTVTTSSGASGNLGSGNLLLLQKK